MCALTNQSGAVATTYAYDAYGNQTASTGNVYNPLRYAGEYQDSQTGFYYLRARYYDPATAQFLTRDPLVAATAQAYTYANGSPLNYADPSGNTAIAIPIGIGVVACGPLCWAALGGVVTGVVLYLVITKLIQDYHNSQICVTNSVWQATTNTSISAQDSTVAARKLGRFSGDKRTAREIIAKEKEAGILREFPGEWLDRTPDDIYKAAQGGNARARTAKKLLDRERFRK